MPQIQCDCSKTVRLLNRSIYTLFLLDYSIHILPLVLIFRTKGSCGGTDAEVLNLVHFPWVVALNDVLMVSYD